jgi:hypothetical protein
MSLLVECLLVCCPYHLQFIFLRSLFKPFVDLPLYSPPPQTRAELVFITLVRAALADGAPPPGTPLTGGIVFATVTGQELAVRILIKP